MRKIARRLAMKLWHWAEPEEYYAYCFWLIRTVEEEHGVPEAERFNPLVAATVFKLGL